MILNWRAVCGDCRACNRGEPWYCFATHNATQKMTLEDGTELSPGAGHRRLRREDAGRRRPVHEGRPVGPRGRGRPARLRRDGRPRRGDQHRQRQPRQVGRRHRLRRRRRRRDRRLGAGRAPARSSPSTSTTEKLEGAKKPRRHRTRSTAGAPTRSRRSRQLTGGFGADVVIDAVGRPETWKQAFYARDLAGTVVLVGVPTPDMKIPDIPLIDVFGRGGSLKSSWYGDCLPSRDFPMLVDLYRQGRLDLDAFVTEEIGLGDVEAAFDKMHHGDVLRSVVVLLMRSPLGTGRPRRRQRHLLPRRGDLRRRQQRLGGRRRRGVRGDRRPARRRRDPRGRGGAAGQGDRLHPRPRRPRPGRTGAARAVRRADPAAPRRPAAVGADPPDDALGRRPRRRPDDRGRRHHAEGAAHARATRRARSASTSPTSAACSPATPCSRAARARPAGRSATAHDRGLDPRRAVRAAGRDRRAHRPRRRHHDRCRARAHWSDEATRHGHGDRACARRGTARRLLQRGAGTQVRRTGPADAADAPPSRRRPRRPRSWGWARAGVQPPPSWTSRPASYADAAAGPRGPGDRRRLAGTAAPVTAGPVAAPGRCHRLRRQRRLDRPDPRGQPRARARCPSPLAAVPGGRPGGRHRRARPGTTRRAFPRS